MRRARRVTVKARIVRYALAGPACLVLILADISPGAATAAVVTVPLPLLPPPHVRYPGLFDEDGCALLVTRRADETTRVCPAPTPTATSALSAAHDPPWQRLLGYEGPYYSSTVAGSGVVVLPESVGFASSDRWGAAGLVRNDTLAVVTDVTVVAQLLARDGSVLSTSSTPVPVRDVRPGEPAPFALATTTPRASVSDVRWRVLARPAPPSAADARMVEITVARLLALDDPGRLAARTVDIGFVRPSRTTQDREVCWGMLKSWSGRSIRRPSVVGMWLDDEGRGVVLLPGRVSRRHGTGTPRARLKRGATAEFVLFLPARVPAQPLRQAPARVAFWATAS